MGIIGAITHINGGGNIGEAVSAFGDTIDAGEKKRRENVEAKDEQKVIATEQAMAVQQLDQITEARHDELGLNGARPLPAHVDAPSSGTPLHTMELRP